MARIVLAAASLALLSLGAVAPALASPSATVVIQTGTPYYQHPVQRPALAPLQVTPVQYHAPPPPRYEAPAPCTPRHGLGTRPLGMARWPPRVDAGLLGEGPSRLLLPRTPLGRARRSPPDAPRRWDRDGDGVPNRHDRRPDNPYRN